MKLTNYAKLPKPMYDLILGEIYRPDPKVLRVSELIRPPLQKYLAMTHWEDITLDASEFFNTLLGTSVHYMLEQMKDGALTEQLLRIPIPGTEVTLKGTLDRYDLKEERLEDWKTPSVFSLVFGIGKGMPEYQRQLNVYKWMLNHLHPEYDPKTLRLNAMCKDWRIREAQRGGNYPAIAFQFVDLPVWSYESEKAYVNERIKLHLSDPKEFKECTPEEKWQNDSEYAIKRKGTKSAIFATNPFNKEKMLSKADCMEVINRKGLTKDAESGKVYIEERPQECTNCVYYCIARDVCPYSDKSKVVHCRFDKDNVHKVEHY